MIHLPHWIPVYLFRPMGWVLVHALWQVLLVALLYRGVSMLLQRRSPRLRYGAGYVALLICLVLPLLTFSALSRAPISSSAPVAPSEGASHTPSEGGSFTASGRASAASGLARNRHVSSQPLLATPAPPSARAVSDPLGRAFAVIDPWMPTVLALWAFGVVVGVGRLVLAWRRACELAHRNTGPVPNGYLELLGRLQERLGVDRAIRLRRSHRVDSPALVGWHRPVILLPASATRLAERAVEPVLAHELAHIRRRDYAANLIQSAIERIFFFHPLLHWLSTQVRAERELCCDDLAARACEGGPIAYARGLASLEALRVGAPALAATEGNLMARIRRLVEPGSVPRHRTVVALVLLAGWVVLAGAAGDLLSRSEAATVLDGLDPIQLIAGTRVYGSSELAVEHAGYRYFFADAASRSRFLADPQRYAVANVAICPISGRRVRADIFRVVDGHLLLFCCPEVGDLEGNRRLAGAVLRAALSGG